MGKYIDIAGNVYGRLTAVAKVGNHKRGYAIWKCSCECGSVVNVRSDQLKNGNTKSCGCLMVEKFTQPKTKHGLSNHKLYGVWRGMKQRCSDPMKQGYNNYGGRGIRVCEEWYKDFIIFFDWCMSHGYKKGLQIDRIDNDGNYSPDNCRFVTPSENRKNQGRKDD